MAGSGTKRAEVITNFKGQDYRGDASFDYAAAESKLMPICALTPFMGSNWMIKARVLERSEVKQWNNAKGSGTLMSCTLVDSNGTEVRATFFKDGLEKFYNLLTVGAVNYFGKGNVKAADKRWNSLPHDYEIMFDGTSIVQPVKEGDAAKDSLATSATTSFLKLSELPLRQPGTTVDLRAIVSQSGIASEVTQKSTGLALKKRSVQVACPSGASCEVTLWHEQTAHNPKPGQPVVMKGLRVATYKGTFSLGANSSSAIQWAPESCEDLTKWWEETGKGAALVNLSQRTRAEGEGEYSGSHRVGFDVIEKDSLGRGEKPDYINIRGTITKLREEQLYYDACPGVNAEGKLCNKKLESTPTQCTKCGHQAEKAAKRYIASMHIADHTADYWATAFNEQAQDLFGCPASALAEDPSRVDQVKEQVVLAPATMTVALKEEVTPMGESRMRLSVIRARLLKSARDWDVECRNFLRDIARYEEEMPQAAMP